VQRLARSVGLTGLGLAGLDLTVLHLLPRPVLHTSMGATVPYQPTNFLSELVRTDYGNWMTLCFVLLAIGAAGAAGTLRTYRREAALLAVAGLALALLAFFPTDLADLTTDDLTCGQPTRIEPCTWIGRVHNPLSTAVFVPIFAAMVSLCARRRREPEGRRLIGLTLVCGLLMAAGVVAASLYLNATGWHGRWWTGLMQRSLVVPALLWVGAVLYGRGDAPWRLR
jgi:hypothetical protein